MRKCADSDHPAHAQSIIRALLSVHTFCSIQYLCKRIVKAGSACADAQADLGLRCPHMPKDTFSQGAAQIRVAPFKKILLCHIYMNNENLNQPEPSCKSDNCLCGKLLYTGQYYDIDIKR